MLKSYAYFRFSRFCSEVEDFNSDLNKVLSQADNALFDLENEILDADTLQDDKDRRLGYETARIRKETIEGLKKVINAFAPDAFQPQARAVKKPSRDRIIKRDVATRYIARFGGRSQWIQTDADAGYPILIDRDGDIRGSIDPFDAFPKSVEILDDMPF